MTKTTTHNKLTNNKLTKKTKQNKLTNNKLTKKTKQNKQIKIMYSGIGSNKSNNHTKKQFLKIAQKHFPDCISKKCKNDTSCKLVRKCLKKIFKNDKVDFADYFKKVDECNKCKKKYKCDLKEYIKYSGARIL